MEYLYQNVRRHVPENFGKASPFFSCFEEKGNKVLPRKRSIYTKMYGVTFQEILGNLPLSSPVMKKKVSKFLQDNGVFIPNLTLSRPRKFNV